MLMCGLTVNSCRQGMQARTEEDRLLDKVFQQVHIPRSLEEVDDYERDHDRLAGNSTSL